MESFRISQFLQSDILNEELKGFPYKINFYFKSETDSPYSVFNVNGCQIVFKDKESLSEMMVIHEMLHLKMKHLGHAYLKFTRIISENLRECFGRLHSTFEHINYVYPRLKEFGFQPYFEATTRRHIDETFSRMDHAIYRSLWSVMVICCCYYETEDAAIKERIIKRIKSFPVDCGNMFMTIIDFMEKSLQTTCIEEKNNILKEIIKHFEYLSQSQGAVSIVMPSGNL